MRDLDKRALLVAAALIVVMVGLPPYRWDAPWWKWVLEAIFLMVVGLVMYRTIASSSVPRDGGMHSE